MSASDECPNGKVYPGSKKKRHVFKTVSRVKMPKSEKRGDWKVVDRCTLCGEETEYYCIFA